MKLVGVISTAVLSLTLGVAAPVYAQQEQHEQQEEQKAKPAQDEKKAQPEKPAKQEEKNAQEEKNTKPEEKNAKQEQQRAPEAKPEKQEQHASGGRIPADRYKANFGREHTFRVSQGDYSSGRFQYGGYWFGFGGAWPSNWLYTQDVYVIEIDGMYYLCNPMYPGVNLVINVTL
ncbi:exported hypothetical protein [Candidatus Sulfotelmatobacter kueseliae]|uniref:Uncharacterized protein n=1 Tax=Candidatus Sulfotelmatobacter kueseliae TaxID=2042962 RepID=A0A2U3KQE5_9BACT|nr:exported hypothetical protein [Candidatus Sulfotelmatobacter kueseliae]